MIQLYLILNLFKFLIINIPLAKCSFSEKAIGTVLPLLTADSRYRVFNDLMKQSTKFEAYSINYGRQWNSQVNIGLELYPRFLPINIIAGAKINLFEETDFNLISKEIRCSFEGDGVVIISQNNSIKITLDNSKKAGVIKIENLNSLMVYIIKTNPDNIVRNIKIIPTEEETKESSFLNNTDNNNFSNSNKTFSQTFLQFLKPFNLIRLCFWQGQSLNKANYQVIWQSRTTSLSASQVSSNFGIALEHIIELSNCLKIIPWLCIPETADDNYIEEFAKFLRTKIPENQKIYLEFGNAFTVMNDIPDSIINPKFSKFLNFYGKEYRDKVVFAINYRNAQYFINAIGMRQSPVNLDYIDVIGIEANFANNLNIFNAYNLSQEELKNLIINKELEEEILINRAFKFSRKIGKELIAYGSNFMLKAPRYEWRFIYDFKKIQTEENLKNKNQEINLSEQLRNFYQNDFVTEIFHNWLIRLSNIGLKTIVSPIFVDPFTDDRDFVPLMESLEKKSENSKFYKAFVAFSRNESCSIGITNESNNGIEIGILKNSNNFK